MSEPHPSTEARRRRQSCVRCFLTGLLVLVACNVGPRYTRPSVVTPTAFKEGGPEAYASLPTGTWQPARPRDATVKGKWWEMFDEPELDLLETQLNIDNQTIAEYFQNFMAARAQVEQARAGYYPTVSVNPSYTVVGAGASAAGTVAGGQSSSSTGATMAAGTTTGGATMGAAATGSARNGVTNFFSLPFDVSWAPDLWGRVRNTVHEYQYAAQVSAADLENERLTEQAALAAYYFELRGQDWLQDVYDHTVVADRNALDLTRSLVGTGIDGEVALAEAEVTLANAEAAAVGAATNRAIYEHAIATLIGRPASAFSMPVRSLTARAPAIPIGLPSQLLERRPDVAAAERTMAGANALIGVAKTAYYPSITLSGSVGVASDTLGTLFSLPAFLWSLGA